MSQDDEVSASRKPKTPDVFTTEKIKAICDRIRAGSFVRHACERERVTERGLYYAIERDPQVALDVHEAQAESEENLLAQMAVNTFDWKREAWLLERKRRDLFKPPTKEVDSKNEHTGKDGSPLPSAVTIVVASEEEMIALAARKIGTE